MPKAKRVEFVCKDNTLRETSESTRIPSLDFLRGIAILGILFINIENFAFPDPWSPWKYGFENELDRHTRFWVYFLTQGKFYNMFALLFGVGFYIFLERLEKKNIGLKAMDIYARRLLWLFVIGIIHAYFVWEGDVLYHYAICGFLLFPFRSMNNKSLMLIMAIFITIGLGNTYIQTAKRIASFEKYTEAAQLPERGWTVEQQKRNVYWTNKLKIQKPDTSKFDAPKETYWKGIQNSFTRSKVHKGTIYYSGLLFPSLLIMIIGILLYRSGIFQDYHIWKHYWFISLTLLLFGLVINYFRFYQWTYESHKPILSHWQAALFTFPKETLGVAYILILNGLFQKFFIKIRIGIISKVGRMALTNYIFQNILLGIIFYGYGFARFNQYSRFELIGIVLAIWIVQLVLSWAWLRKFKQGPLESLWRNLTYYRF